MNTNNKDNKNAHITKTYEQFFLGLLEGGGSIQVNHWKKRYLQFRIVVKLKYTDANYTMCTQIQKRLGIMNLHIRHGYIIMVEDSRVKIRNIMVIIEKHGLLLTHKRKQYAFFKYCYNKQVTYSEYTHIKSLNQFWSSIINYNSNELLHYSHWPNWLCGFTEAEGCFSIRSNNNHSFSISQKDGYEVLAAIKQTFNIPNKIRVTSRVYILETYASQTLQQICNFYNLSYTVGLMGEKKKQYEAFIISLNQKLIKKNFYF